MWYFEIGKQLIKLGNVVVEDHAVRYLSGEVLLLFCFPYLVDFIVPHRSSNSLEMQDFVAKNVIESAVRYGSGKSGQLIAFAEPCVKCA